ncbi:hypothetical protein SHJG_0870 [Streptomyces hygroscopicus subsp. jinggangensis 5008]|nr:hypothetical protein SHJG_0870 [Streptomyces hygroscopicus subsp. jinggangensis 5008]AGF60369.1 hypothetical protein SHJGH_0703 [Streptomyces hygroscopicus subsp. jinggangensis TL01]
MCGRVRPPRRRGPGRSVRHGAKCSARVGQGGPGSFVRISPA